MIKALIFAIKQCKRAIIKLSPIAAAAGIFLIPIPAFATTNLFVQNNTSFQFDINSTQTGKHILEPDEWDHTSGIITPWQKKISVLKTNRSSGIKSGNDFFFSTVLSSGEENITFKIKLRGQVVHSKMWFSLTGSDFSHPWRNSRKWYKETFTLNNKSITVKYSAIPTRLDDNIFMIIHENNLYSTDAGDRNTINILAYNIYMMRGIANQNQVTRAREIPGYVNGYDVLIFSEVYNNYVRDKILLPGLKSEYPYHTKVLGDSCFFNLDMEDGGVIIVSKWPIEHSKELFYSKCEGSDCFSAKGALYARINKLGKKYHIFGTHTEAWNNEQEEVSIRLAQLGQLRKFVDSINIPKNEPVLIGGDLNVDKHKNAFNEYNKMLRILNTPEPRYIGYPYTYDPVVNSLCSPESRREYLDYILPIRDFLSPKESSNEVRILRSPSDLLKGIDLSDHFSVYGRFVFPQE
ncbi:MAG: sphingomyelin phosphodiesterase [bacterium]|nr:sphingomyelin phosphodiesterase [bacterium]